MSDDQVTSGAPAVPGASSATDRRMIAAGTALRIFWFVAAPGAIALVTAGLAASSSALTSRSGTGVAPSAGPLEAPLVVAAGTWLVLAAVARHFRRHLPGGRLLAERPRPRRSMGAALGSAALVVGATAVAALVLRGAIAKPYRVHSGSMLPTLLPGDRLVARRAGETPARGDVIVFERAGKRGAKEELVKRVIGLPGDEIFVQSGLPIINGWTPPACQAGVYAHPAAEGHTIGRLYVEFLGDAAYLTVHTMKQLGRASRRYVVKPGEFYVLGDNRHESDDSRSWNFGLGAGVPLADVQGRGVRVMGGARDGGIDWSRLWRPLGVEVALPGTDVTALRDGIARCLRERPQQTTPPGRANASL